MQQNRKISFFNKIFEQITKLLVLWTLLSVSIGYIAPQILIPFKPYLDYMFMFTMLGIGFVLEPADFLPIVKKPLLPLMGTLAQFGIMPVSAFILSKLLNLPKEYALGLIITGSVPGAMASNVISYLAGADVVLSISITTMSTFLSPILTPVFIYLLANTFIKVNFWAMFKSILLMVVLPLIGGLILKKYLKKYIERIISVFPAISTLFIAFICGLIVALNRDNLANISLQIFVAIFLLNAIGLTGGYFAGKLYGFPENRRRTLAIEVGMQNAGLGAVLGLKHFSAVAALPSALFATWCVITASLLAGIWGSKNIKV